MKNKKLLIIIISLLGILACLFLLDRLYDQAAKDCLKLHSADYCDAALKDLKK